MKISSIVAMMVVLSITCLMNVGIAVPTSVTIKESPDVSLPGNGQSAELVTLTRGLTIFNMTYDGSELDVDLLDSKGNREASLVFMLDPFAGSLSKVVGIEEAGLYALDIVTDGNWTIDLVQPDETVGL